MDSVNSVYQELCRQLASELLYETVDRFSHEIRDLGGISTASLVSGTRDACFSLSELGALSIEKRGYYTPCMPSGELEAWMKERTYTRQEQDLLLRGMCHLWSWFLSSDYNYRDNLIGMKPDMQNALESAEFITESDAVPYWSPAALPWLVEASLAELSEVVEGSKKDGFAILSAMPDVRVQNYAKLAENDALRVFCLLCANWDGSNWHDRGRNFILPHVGWLMSSAKSALGLIRHAGSVS